MTTPEERDYIGEVISEDAAEREALRWQLKGFIPGVEGLSKAVFKPWVVQAKDYDELRQQLADVSNERDLLRADRDAEKAMKAKAREQRDRLMTRCVELEGLLGDMQEHNSRFVSFSFSDFAERIESALSKPAESEQASCNNEREDLGVPLNTPCKACGRGPCIDR